jgi:hypothetical protein
MHKIPDINISKEKKIKAYTEKVESKYYKRNEIKMQNQL